MVSRAESLGFNLLLAFCGFLKPLLFPKYHSLLIYELTGTIILLIRTNIPAKREISPSRIIMSKEGQGWSNLPLNQGNKWERLVKFKGSK